MNAHEYVTINSNDTFLANVGILIIPNHTSNQHYKLFLLRGVNFASDRVHGGMCVVVDTRLD